MIGSLSNIFRIPDLRKKIFYTAALLTVFRLGAHVPIPFIDPNELAKFMAGLSGLAGGVFSFINMFSGGAFKQMTVFSFGIMPYISASIILQLLTIVWPYLERLSKEGEAGRKKINQYTRYGTVAIAMFQAFGLSMVMLKQGLVSIPDYKFLFILTTMVSVTAGTCFIMWLGEKITEKGIGNGISLIIAIGILASYPFDIAFSIKQVQSGVLRPIWIPTVLVLMVAVSALIILIQQGQRKIPIQHAKRVVGRKVTQGGTTYLPLRINTAGVIPVIFASSIMMFPSTIFGFFGEGDPTSLWTRMSSWLGYNSPYNLHTLLTPESGGILLLLKCINIYTIVDSLMVAFFCFFYTAIVFNPTDTAENLRKYGAFIPGKRPGKPTAEYIDFVLTRITLVGAIFLVVVALVPKIIQSSFQSVPYQLAQMAGGTGLIIVVGVMLDTMKKIESSLLMRHYDGFMKSGRKAARKGRW